MVFYLSLWEPKSVNCCQLHPAKTLGLWGGFAWTSSIKWIFQGRAKGVSNWESQTILSDLPWLGPSERKAKAAQSISPCSLCPCWESPYCLVLFQWASRPPSLWQPLHRCSVSRMVLAPTSKDWCSRGSRCFPLPAALPVPGPRAAPQDRTPTPFLAHGFTHLFLWKNQLLKEGEIKEIQFLKNAFLIGGLNYWINNSIAGCNKRPFLLFSSLIHQGCSSCPYQGSEL